MPFHLVGDDLADGGEGVHVLDLGAHAELFLALFPHGDVDVAAHQALFHAAAARAGVAEQGAQLFQIGHHLVGGAEVRLADDLAQGHGAAVIVHHGDAGEIVVQ